VRDELGQRVEFDARGDGGLTERSILGAERDLGGLVAPPRRSVGLHHEPAQRTLRDARAAVIKGERDLQCPLRERRADLQYGRRIARGQRVDGHGETRRRRSQELRQVALSGARDGDEAAPAEVLCETRGGLGRERSADGVAHEVLPEAPEFRLVEREAFVTSDEVETEAARVGRVVVLDARLEAPGLVADPHEAGALVDFCAP